MGEDKPKKTRPKPPSKVYRKSVHIEELLHRKIEKALNDEEGETIYLFINTAIIKELRFRGFAVQPSVVDRLDQRRDKKIRIIEARKAKEKAIQEELAKQERRNKRLNQNGNLDQSNGIS